MRAQVHTTLFTDRSSARRCWCQRTGGGCHRTACLQHRSGESVPRGANAASRQLQAYWAPVWASAHCPLHRADNSALWHMSNIMAAEGCIPRGAAGGTSRRDRSTCLRAHILTVCRAASSNLHSLVLGSASSHVQLPCWHVWPPRHLLAQIPQLFSSVFLFTHWLAQ